MKTDISHERSSTIQKHFENKPRPNFVPEHEADRIEFIHAGFPCLMHRRWHFGWKGYVFLPEDHPLNGAAMREDAVVDLRVHGGITFAEKTDDGDFALGFDCAHCGDKVQIPGDDWAFNKGVYRHQEFVQSELESLAEQLARVASEEVSHGDET